MTLFTIDQTVIFVDDDEALRRANVQALQLAGIAVTAFSSAKEALAQIDANFTGVLITDVRMPGMDGLELFSKVRERDSEIPIILVTGHADVPMAITALKDGAFDFLTKPFASDLLIATTKKALATRRLVIENRLLRSCIDESDSPLIGDSAAMSQLRERILQVAQADFDVLIEGETGVGKELAALLLHRRGPRRGQPFIAVNCGALTESSAEVELFGQQNGVGRRDSIGMIEASSGGTLFLDEVDSMPLHIQAKLLRVLEEREVTSLGEVRPKPVNLHVIAAAKHNLDEMVQNGLFREDLYYRLSVVCLRIPPLRDRREDIPQLFAHFVADAFEKLGQNTFSMTDAVRHHLLEHDWPGNVRELRNFAYNAVLDLPLIGDHEQDSDIASASLPERVARFEEAVIKEALIATNGNIPAVLSLLRIPRKTLYDKLSRHRIEPKAYRLSVAG